MEKIFTIAKKEFKAYFLSPIAYVYLVAFLVVTNWLFFRGFFLVGQVDLRAFFSLMPWINLFFIPAIAMGKWSEEKKLGTMELLLTLPVTDIQVVMGKFVASFALFVTALVFTLTVPFTIGFLGNMDMGPVIGGYIGLLFLGAAYLSIGLFVSALTENQIVAFILGVIACFVLLLVGEPIFTTSIPNFLVGFFSYLGLGAHFTSIGRGVIDSRDIIYYLSVIGFFLWLNLKVVESRSWK